MKRFEKIKEKTMKIKNNVKKPSFWALSTKLIVDKVFAKTVKNINGIVELSSSEILKIKKITYQITEEVDPIIGKRKEEAESIAHQETKKWFTLKPETEKEISFSLPVKFANHGSSKSWWDLHLLNHMSERSRKTSINYQLIIDIAYLNEKKELKNKVLKHSIHFD